MADTRLGIFLDVDTSKAEKAFSSFSDRLKEMGDKMKDGVSNGRSFGKGVEDVTNNLKKLPQASNQATLALGNLGRVVQDAPFGFIGIANNINPLLESFQRLKATTGTTGGALKAMGSSLMGAGGLGFAVSVVSSLLVVFGDKLFGAGKSAKEAADKTKNFKDVVQGIFENAGKEAAGALTLIAVLKSETETRERKLLAIKELQKIQPDVFKNLKLEGNEVKNLDTAYQSYLTNLRTAIMVKIKQAQLETLITKQLEMQGRLATESEKEVAATLAKINKERIEAQNKMGDAGSPLSLENLLKRRASDRQAALDSIQKDIDGLFKEIQEFSKGVKLTAEPDVVIKPKKPVKFDLKPVINIPEMEVFKDSPFKSTLFDREIREATRSANFGEIDTTIGPAMEAWAKHMQAMQQNANMLADIFSSVLTPAISGFFSELKKGGNVFKAFADAAVNALIGLIEKLMTAAVLSALLSLIPGTGPNGSKVKFGDMFLKLLGFGGGMASGGPVSAGRTFLVGEQGPELFVPNQSGRIIPNHSLGGIMSTGGQISVSVDGRISGNDLALVLNRNTNYLRRNG